MNQSLRFRMSVRNWFRIFLIATCVIGLLILYHSCTTTTILPDQFSFRHIQSHFLYPPVRYYPATYWLWNSNITREEIDFQLEEFIDKGIGSVIIGHGSGLKPQIFSEDWQNLITTTKSYAESLGINIWLDNSQEPVKKGIIRSSVLKKMDWIKMPDCTIFENSVSEKLSIKKSAGRAHQLGRTRVLSKLQFNDSEETFASMKYQTDRIFILGGNSICLYQSLFSIHGCEKTFLPTFSYHSSWWELFRTLSDYMTRMSLVFQSGNPVQTILVLDPTAYNKTISSAESSSLNLHRFETFLDSLDLCHVEYDLGSESMLCDYGKVKHGQLYIGHQCYSMIILPPGIKNLNQSTVNLLKKLLKSRGKIICFGCAPSMINGKLSNNYKTWTVQYQDCWIQADSVSTSNLKELLNSPEFTLIDSGSMNEKLYCRRDRLSDGQLLFFINTSFSEPVKGKILTSGEAVFQMNAMEGTIEKYPSVPKNHHLEIDIHLQPASSLLLFCAMTDTFDIQPSAVAAPNRGKLLRSEHEMNIVPTYYNSWTLDHCDIYTAESNQRMVPVCQASKMISEDQSIQVQYPFNIHKQVDASTLMAVIEEADQWQIKVNGNSVKPLRDAWLLDRRFGVLEIGSFTHPGENVLTITNHSNHVEIAPVYIFGEFELVYANGWQMSPVRLMTLKSWKDQGMPFYSDAVSYIKAYDIVKDTAQYWLKLGQWYGTVAEVRINDCPAGIISWPPYSLNVTPYIKDGENHVEVIVYGSLKNVFQYIQNEESREINENDMMTYGLFDDYQLIRY